MLSLYHQKLPEKNVIHFSHMDVNKKPLNQTLQKLFDGGSGSEGRHVL